MFLKKLTIVVSCMQIRVSVFLRAVEGRRLLRRNISECPVCDTTLNVTELTCPHCQTRLQGQFDRPPLIRVAPEHQAFIEIFVRCRGIIRDVERALGISYPTVRARLDAAVDALEIALTEPDASASSGPAPPTHPADAPPDPARKGRRRAVLRQVEEGSLEAAEAAEILRHL